MDDFICCLKYENDEYESAKKALPDLGQVIDTPLGSGKVVGINILGRILQINIPEQDRVVEYTLDEILKEGAVSVQSTD